MMMIKETMMTGNTMDLGISVAQIEAAWEIFATACTAARDTYMAATAAADVVYRDSYEAAEVTRAAALVAAGNIRRDALHQK